MIYISIDIETTGTDRENDQVLEFAAIIEDTTKQLPFDEIPKFETILKHDRLSGNAFALNMNARLIEILAKIPPKYTQAYLVYMADYNIIRPQDLGFKFTNFLIEELGYEESIQNGQIKPIKVLAAGKNFDSFDKQFLQNIPEFSTFVEFNRRSINPAEYFIEYFKDTQPPSLDVCLQRAGFEKDKVSHKALDDAWDVIKVLRTQYHRSYKDQVVALDVK